MSSLKEDRRKQGLEDNIEWSSFEQYKHIGDICEYKPGWSKEYINQIVVESHPSDVCKGIDNTEMCNRNSPQSNEDQKWKINGLSFYLEQSDVAVGLSTLTNSLSSADSYHLKYSKAHESQMRTRSGELWDRLLDTSNHKKPINKRTATWRHYLVLLPLRRNVESKAFIGESRLHCHSPTCLSPLTSDTSDSEESDICDSVDPMYSKFGVLRNGFYVSEDGMVFCSRQELEEYKRKMLEMKRVLQVELAFIKSQHMTIEAKKSEERKLLSSRLDSQESDVPDEPDEDHGLNAKGGSKGSKPERKSALFSSFQDAFSYAKTGIQGIFDKNSQPPSRSTKSQPDYDSDESEDEHDKTIKVNRVITDKNSDDLLDNHDEFTRQMTAEGGLKYQSGDKSVQQVSYQSLPPPLSLDALQINSTDETS